MLKFFSFVLFSLLLHIDSWAFAASDAVEDAEAYWDYGFGFGAVRFEHYPASDQSRTFALPFPTFQYRGKILRADDRDGAHLYIFKGATFTLEVSGNGTPALKSSDNNARQGMEDLPWMAALGPKLVMKPTDSSEVSINAYQFVATDFVMTRTMGSIYEARYVYEWNFPFRALGPFQENGVSNAQISFSVRSGSKEYLALYFEVPESQATAERPKYDARDGLLSHSVSYFQSFKSGRVALYLGGGLHSYELSANRQSPLHKSDHNITALVGFNYTLGESTRPAIPEKETSGLLGARRNLKGTW
jgi:outer membrane scaffolding protein for murein synthesis (MipA/OmpV family)